jgi:peptidoglycan/LPS O-acetylase OafA/YrhL
VLRDRTVVVGGVLAAVCVNAVLGYATGTATLLAVTPAGIAIYLFGGVAIPQFVVHRRTASTGALGASALAGVASGAVLVAALLDGGLYADWGGGFVTLLTLALLGVVLSASWRAFAEGYRG